jgi:hypothetical protein
MSPENVVYSDPKSHPDNVNRPNINQEATILGTTVVFFVRLTHLSKVDP